MVEFRRRLVPDSGESARIRILECRRGWISAVFPAGRRGDGSGRIEKDSVPWSGLIVATERFFL